MFHDDRRLWSTVNDMQSTNDVAFADTLPEMDASQDHDLQAPNRIGVG